MNEYQEFLASKQAAVQPHGFTVASDSINASLFDWQRDIVRWCLRKGRAAIWATTGMGKTAMQCEYARHVADHTGSPVLILAPLAVAQQTEREAAKFGITVRYARSQDEVTGAITVTNYEMLHAFTPAAFGGVVLDESGCLKHFEAKLRTRLITTFARTPYRLCCTATPAPNDIAELANHAEFLGLMTRTEMLATYFVHDDTGWRLKGHAREPFYRWLASWAVALTSPADLGYSAEGFTLPALRIISHILPTEYVPDGMLFHVRLRGVTDRGAVRHGTIAERVRRAADLILADDQPWIAWVGFNDEETALAQFIPDAVVVRGSQTPEQKSAALLAFSRGDARVLITKASIAGYGLNLQHCARQVFVGLGDSYEDYFQCIRRSYRYGQTQDVEAHIVLTEPEQEVFENVQRKEAMAQEMTQQLVQNAAHFSHEEIAGVHSGQFEYQTDDTEGDGWRLQLGDNVELIEEIATGSIGLSVFSPPFQDLYVYSATERDMGNARTEEEFWRHMGFLIPQVLRVTMPGRLCCVHVSQIASQKAKDGVIGLKDFRGKTIEAFTAAGWIHHGEAVIPKNPQAQAIRTKSKALLFLQLHKDASWSRPALLDFILIFRAPGANPEPVVPDLTNDDWIDWAEGTWTGIRETHTLNAIEGRSRDDEKHICPLQLDVIERCVRLWSNPDDTVLDPFAGLGSTGYEALRWGRQFHGLELKPEYYAAAIQNLERMERTKEQAGLFDGLAV